MSKYANCSLDEIAEELSERNLPKHGARVDLVQRLLNDDARTGGQDVAMPAGDETISPDPSEPEADTSFGTASEA